MKNLKLSLIASMAITTLSFAGGNIEHTVINKPVVNAPTTTEEVSSKDDKVEVGASMTMATRNIFRGVDLNDNKGMMVSGSVDLAYKGLYLNVITSSRNSGNNKLEMDIYDGYKTNIAGIGIDIGHVTYLLPDTYQDFESTSKEIYLGVSKEIANYSAGVTFSYDYDAINMDGDDGVYNVQLDAGAKAMYDIKLSANVGMSDAKSTDDYYFLLGATKSVGKFDLGVTYTGKYEDATDTTNDHVVASVSTKF
ncbi:Conserved hypothetical protein 2001 [hydrothermal vent metagenome]|uniref:Porin domain-containing protein n=1 Tax=hydrothermal vent metagenome TaxID=652676 RepID=A0A1W1EJ32_9ZZZZ